MRRETKAMLAARLLAVAMLTVMAWPAVVSAVGVEGEQEQGPRQFKSVSPDKLAEFKRRAQESVRAAKDEAASQSATAPAEAVHAPTTQPAVTAGPTTQPASAVSEAPAQPPAAEAQATVAAAPTTQPAVAEGVTTEPADLVGPLPPTERVYNFNWKDRQWKDALEDFSRMSGLGVIGDVPKGTVTYINAQPMTYTEALRAINDLLFYAEPPKGYHLARRERYLLVKALSEWERLIPKKNFYDSEEDFRAAGVDDFEFVRILYSPELGLVEELIEKTRGVMPDYCRIGPVGGTNMMSIACMAGDARKFLDYVHRFECQTLDPREQKIFKLEHAPADSVLAILRQLVDFGGARAASAARRKRGPAAPAGTGVDNVVAAVEKNNNWLIIKAPAQRMRKIEKLVELLDVPGAADAAKPRVFKLSNARAEELAGIITRIVSRQGPSRRPGKARSAVPAAGKPTIVPEPRTNSLIVMADDEQLEQIEVLIKQFDVSLGEEGFKRVPLKHARTEQLVQTINTLLAARASGGPKRRGPIGGVQVVADPTGNAVLVAGEPAEVNRVTQMIADLDQESVSDSLEHIVQLESAKPSTLAKVLGQIFGGPAGRKGSQTGGVRFYGFDESNVLVVTAPPSEWVRIEPLILDLDSRAKQIGAQVYTWQIEHGDAQEMANSINQILAGAGKRRSPLRVVGDSRTGTVLAQCDQSQFEQIDRLVETFDSPGEDQEAELIELEHASPQELTKILQQMFIGRKPRGKGAEAVQIVAAGNGVLVKAPAQQYQRIAEMVARLDQPGMTEEVTFKTYSLKRVQAETLAKTLLEMFKAKAKQLREQKRGPAPSYSVSAEAGSNQLMVTAPQSLLSIADELVARVDAEDVEGVRVDRIIELESADGNQVAKVVSQSLGELARRGKQQAVVVTSDAAGKRVVISGLAVAVDRAEQLVKQLDAEEAGVELQTFELQEADAEDVASMIQMLMVGPAKKGPRAAVAKLQITADPRINTLFVSAGPEDMTKVEELVALLDKPATTGRPMNFINVKSQDVEGVAERVRRMAESRWPSKKETPTIEADTFFDSLIVISTDEQYEQIVKMVERADQPDPGELVPVTLAYEPKKADTQELLEVLRQYADAYGYRLKIKTVEKPPVEQEPWRELLEEVVPGEPRAVHPCVLPMNLAALSRQVDALLGQTTAAVESTGPTAELDQQAAGDDETDQPGPEVTITVDEEGRIILYGPQQALKDLESLMTLIDESAPEKVEKQELKIYRLKHIDAVVAAGIIDQMFNEPARAQQAPKQATKKGVKKTPEQVKKEAEARKKAADAARRAAAARQRVRVLPDVRNNWLIVRALPEDLDPVLKLLATIDVPQEISIEIKIIPLTNLNAADVEQALKAVLQLDGPRPTAAAKTPAQRARARSTQQIQERLLELRRAEGITSATIGAGASITITSDRTMNALIVSAPAAQMKLITGLIDELEGQETAASEVRKIPLVHARVEEVVPQLEKMFAQKRPGRTGARGAKAAPAGSPLEIGEVTFAADTRTNSVIARGATKDLDAVGELIKQLDQEGEDAELELFALTNADAASMVRALQETYMGAKRRGRDAGSADVRISAESVTNTVLVWGPKSVREQIGRDIRMMDEQPSQRVVRLIQLENGDADSLARTLQEIYVRGRRTRRGGGPPGQQVQITGNAAARTILVSAPEEVFSEIEQVIKQLDVGADQARPQTKVIKLEHAQARDVADILTRNLNQSRRRGQPQAAIVANEPANSLVITASEKELADIEQLVQTLDVAPDEQKDRIIQPIKLTYADPNAMANAIREAFRLRGARPRPEDIVTATAEWGTNSVLISATREKFEEIKKLVEEMDKPGAGTRVTKVVRVVNADAADVARSLFSLFIWQGTRTRRGQSAVQIEHVRGTDKILITGMPTELEEVERVIETLDQPDTADQRGMEVVQLTNLSPTEAHEILTDYLRKGDRGNDLIGNVRITPSQSIGGLVVSGSPSQVAQVVALAKKLDEPAAEGGSAPRLVSLKVARASQLAETLTRIFTDPARDRGRSRRGPQELVPVIVADDLTNTLIVRASANDFTRIEEMAQEIDSRQEEEGGAVKVIQVAEGIDVVELAGQIERTINQGEAYRARKIKGSVPSLVSIGVDERTGALLVAGSADQFAEVEKLVRKLEQLKPVGPTRMRIITLDNIPAEEVQRVLDQILEKQRGRSTTPRPRSSPRRRTTPSRRRGELPQHMRRFGTPVLAMNDQAALGRWLTLSILAQASSQPATGATTQPAEVSEPAPVEPFEEVALPDAQISGEVTYSVLDERSIILQGDDHDLAILEAIIRQIDTDAPRLETRVFSLENAQATDIGSLLQKTFQEMIRSMGKRARPEDTVSIIPVPPSNSLIIAALPERMEQIEVLINQLDEKPTIGDVSYETFELKYIQAAEAKAALDSLLKKLWAKRGAKEQVTIEADERVNALIVTGSEKDLVQIKKFIDTIDVKPAFATAEMMVVPLLNAEAKALANVIDEMLKTAPAGGGASRKLAEQIRRLKLRAREGDEIKELPELDLEKPIKVIPEPGTNSLIISSNPDNLLAMEQVIELLDRVPVWHGVKMRIFMLEHADADELAKMLEDIFKQGRTLPSRPSGDSGKTLAAVAESATGEALAYQVGIAADVRTNALVVSGREDSLALAETLVMKLDQPGLALKFPIQLFALEHADAQRIADVITKLMDSRLEALKKAGETTLAREQVFIEADLRANLLIISAKQDNYEEIVELAHKLDSVPDALIDEIRIINLEKTQANTLKPKIEALWARRAALRKAAGSLIEDRPIVETDERSNSLVIAANREDFEMIKRLIDQLEAQPLSPIAEIRLIRLEHNDASTIAPMVKKLFDERVKMRMAPGQQPLPGDSVAVEFDQSTNALIVASSRENYDSMVELLRQIDVEMPIGGVVQFFQLEYADANRVSEVISELFEEGLWKPGSLGVETPIAEARNKVAIQVDERSNTIIVSASKENYSIIETLIDEMDTAEDFLVGNLQLFPLRYADVVKMASMLEDLFDKMQSAKKSVSKTVELPMTIIPELRTNTLIIAGSRDGLTRAASLIEKFDRRAGPPTADFRVYQLRDADAVRIAPTIERLFEERAPSDQKGTPFLIEADAGSNSLIVSASREDHDLVASLVAMLDKPSTTAEQVEVFALQKAKAEDLRKILEDLYGKRMGKGQEQTLVFAADERTNSLIIFGGPGDLKDVARVVERMDTAEAVDEQTVRIFRLKQADAEKMTEIIGEIIEGDGAASELQSVLISFIEEDEYGQLAERKMLRERVQIIPDIRTNSLIVMATPDGIDMLEHLIKSLDAIDPELAEIEVIRLRNADAGEMVKTLEELFEVEVSGAEGEEERRLVISGPGAALIGAEGASAGGRAWLQFASDVRTNSIIVAGSKEYLHLVRELITKLDAEAADERVQKVIALKNAEADGVQGAIREFMDAEIKRLEELGEEAALRKMEREIAIVAYEDTNQVMLSVSPRYESQITELIDELDQPPPQVMIQALLAEVSLTNRFEMGMEWALQDLLFSSTATVGNNNMLESNNFDVVVGTDLGAGGTGLGGFSFTISGEDFSFLLRVLESEGKVEVLSAPRIMVMDNQEAEFNVGQQVPIVGGVQFLDGRTQTTVQYQDVGVILQVTPHINPDGFVNMEVRPEISSISDSTVTITEGVFAPIFNKNFVQTMITVKDGETAVIGGLITSNESESENKVPILGDLPLIGPLFRATQRNSTKTELLILLTPRVVRTVEDLREISVAERDRTDLLPESILTSPLMEGLQVQPEQMEPLLEELLEQPGAPGPVRYELPKVKPYGPPRSLLTGRTMPGRISSLQRVAEQLGEDYDYYLRQRY